MRGSIRIGRLFGIPVTVNVSWFLILALVVGTLATRGFPSVFDGKPWWFYWLLAVVAAVVFFASMVLHELGHSVVARYFGIPVRSITLFLLGAVAQTGRETRRPGQEFLMAVAGPAVSLLIAGLFMVLWFLTGMGDSTFSVVCEWLWLTNFAVGIFNLVPAYPMDGGRVLRSVVWGITGNYRRATHWAALVGRGFAYTVIGAGLLIALGVGGPFESFGPLSAVQFILIGLFIDYAARQSDVQSGVLDFLSGYRVGDVMLRDIPVATAGTSVREALDGPLAGYGAAREWLLISDGDHFAGLAPRAALQLVPDERQNMTDVGGLAIPAARLQAVAPDDTLNEVVQRMDADQSPVLVVVDHGQVSGIVHRGQIAGLMSRRATAEVAHG